MLDIRPCFEDGTYYLRHGGHMVVAKKGHGQKGGVKAAVRCPGGAGPLENRGILRGAV